MKLADLDQYITAVKAKLASGPIIASIEIVDERTLLNRGYFRARLTLVNTDFLEIAESFTIQDKQLITLDYRYQWMGLNKFSENAGIVSSIFHTCPISLIMSTLIQNLKLNLGYLEIL